MSECFCHNLSVTIIVGEAKFPVNYLAFTKLPAALETAGFYHGSNALFAELRAGSTITQWRELAEAFSHKPASLSYDDSGQISHNGKEPGYLYVIDEPITVGSDCYQHPRTVMDVNAEFLTKRPLRVRLVAKLPV